MLNSVGTENSIGRCLLCSVLGPLLFIVYINDTDDQINSRLLKFADDTKIYFKVNSPENIERLKEDLCKLVSWSKEWQMLFSVEKCKVMHLGYDNPHASYFMDGNRLQVVSEERDLGVIMSEDLKLEKQCVVVVKQGNKMLGMIKRNFYRATHMHSADYAVARCLSVCPTLWDSA